MHLPEEFRKFAVKHLGIGSHNLDRYASIQNSAYGPSGIATHRVDNMTRSIIEERPTNFREIDVFSRLMADRIIFLGTPVESNIANIIVAQLLFLDSVDAKKDILLYINSPGGSVYDGLGIYDTMQWVRPDVSTIATSLAASMAAVLLSGGAPGKRAALPHARIMIHQPSGGMQGQSKDMEITLKETVRLRSELYDILAKHTKQTFEKVELDSDRDYWMRAPEAKEYGLIDEVLERV